MVKKMIDSKIIRSLNRSKLKIKILKSLNKQTMYLSQLSKECNTDVSSIMYAIRGYDKRYNPELSMINLGLVEEVYSTYYSYYKITELGKKCLKEYSNDKKVMTIAIQ